MRPAAVLRANLEGAGIHDVVAVEPVTGGLAALAAIATRRDAPPLFVKAFDSGPADSGPADSGPADSGPADSGPADSGPARDSPADDVFAAEADGLPPCARPAWRRPT